MIVLFAATYLIHSTLLLGLAFGARLMVRRAALREILVRGALFGAAATAAVQSSGVVPATFARQRGATPMERIEEKEIVSVTGGDLSSLALFRTPAAQKLLDGESVKATMGTRARTDEEPGAMDSRMAGTAVVLRNLLALLWATGALLFLVRLTLGHLSLRYQLRQRREVQSPDVSAVLRALAQSCGLAHAVRLTESAAITVPIALGRNEICLPAHSPSSEDAAQLRTVLAHEVAHLQRRDPMWFCAVDLVASLFWYQPLNWVGRRQLRENAELLCDDAVVRATGDRRTFAECLLQLARQLEGTSRGAPSVVAGLGNKRSLFIIRVSRVLHGDEGTLKLWERVAVLGVSALTLGATLAVPPVAAYPRQPALVNEELTILRRSDGAIDTTQHQTGPSRR